MDVALGAPFLCVFLFLVTGSLVTSKEELGRSLQKVEKEGWDGDVVHVTDA